MIQKHPLATFFLLVFALTWPLQIVDAIASHGLLSWRVPLLFQILFVAYMPTLAAIITAAAADGRAGVSVLLKRLLVWRVKLRWYAVAIFGYAVVCGSAVLIGNLLTKSEPIALLAPSVSQSAWTQLIVMIPMLFLVVTLVNGEELAWRGFALPRLQARFTALTSSLILGLVWTAFHLPLFFTLVGPALDLVGMISRSIQLVAASVIFTWLFNHTNGSVLLAYLLHGSVNTWTRVFPLETAPPAIGWMLTLLLCAIALVLLIICGPRHLSRTRPRVLDQHDRSPVTERSLSKRLCVIVPAKEPLIKLRLARR